jgi:hypothetical protein
MMIFQFAFATYHAVSDVKLPTSTTPMVGQFQGYLKLLTLAISLGFLSGSIFKYTKTKQKKYLIISISIVVIEIFLWFVLIQLLEVWWRNL